jgi:hypothetical protein
MTCPAAVSAPPARPTESAGSPRAFCTSPSSISDVDFSRGATDKASTTTTDKVGFYLWLFEAKQSRGFY